MSTKKLMLLNCSVGEDSWESLGLQGGQTSLSWRKSVLNIHWMDWCWSWSSNTLATWCKELTHWKSPWRWERLKVGEGDNQGWDGWMASLTRWIWVWASSGMHREAWHTAVHGVAKSRTWVSDWTELKSSLSLSQKGLKILRLPGGPVAKTLHSQGKGPRFWLLVGELDPTCWN